MLGNEAIGLGLVEQGCTLAASYPGTPASEVLSSIVSFSREMNISIHTEWSVNEKVAVEVALAHSYTGKRSAVAMKQVGLNVAADPIMRSAYLGVKGGLVIVAADDPGPHSSQTEQDSRSFAQFARIPVLDPISPRDAKELAATAYHLSEGYELPVILRPTTRVCHARQDVECMEAIRFERKAAFIKNPQRWAATPQYVAQLHAALDEKIYEISRDELFIPQLHGRGTNDSCIICSGISFAHAFELVHSLGIADAIDLYRVIMPYPLHVPFIEMVKQRYQRVLVLEETSPVIEMQLCLSHVTGRKSGSVPCAGELTPEVIENILGRFAGKPIPDKKIPITKGKKPSLCAGCGHRAAFFAIKRTFPHGIFPSDIGCYTLGINLGAVDTCLCMGACISQAAGFYFSYRQDNDTAQPIVVTIGDSTFFHSGIPALINAVVQGARFILVILDNSTTAMTGHQPTPQSATLANGNPSIPVLIPDIVKACGIAFVEEQDPYDMQSFMSCLKKADVHVKSDDGGVAVIIARHPCVLRTANEKRLRMFVNDRCNGCRQCIEQFECPAFIWMNDRMSIDENLCIGCGVCVHVCKRRAIAAVDDLAKSERG